MDKTVLGVEFFGGKLEEACQMANEGGLLVAPSGPGLASDLVYSEEYAKALRKAAIVLLDSGLVALWCKVFRHHKITRISGLNFLKNYLKTVNWDEEKSFWVMPDQPQSRANIKWLRKEFNHCFEEDLFYIAPKYPPKGKIVDEELLKKIIRKKPKNIFIQLGGGVQERLGLYLLESLQQKVSILCTGAALAFLTGQQVSIPYWADKLFLGWAFRCLSCPKQFVPRYFKALKLFYLLFRYGRRSPNCFSP